MLRVASTAAAAAAAALLVLRTRRVAGLPAPPPPPAPDGFDVAGGADRLLRKAETVLSLRTDQISVVIERSVDTHNYSAIIRTAEALGIQHLWVISPPALDPAGKKSVQRRKKKDVWVEDAKSRVKHVAFAKKATKWVTLRTFEDTESCLAALREDGRTLWVTDLSQQAHDLDDVLGPASPSPVGLPDRVAVVFGSEGMGVSEAMLKAADLRVYLKMAGFADSLNLSVSAALIIQRLKMAEPGCVGRMDAAERKRLRAMWYPMMGRSEEQKTAFAAAAARENLGVDRQIAPYCDVRRPEEHRRVWTSKKVRNKMGKVGKQRYQGEIK